MNEQTSIEFAAWRVVEQELGKVAHLTSPAAKRIVEAIEEWGIEYHRLKQHEDTATK